jgi:serine/threonine-protein kinase PknG
MVSLMDLESPPFGMPPAERYPVFRSHPLLYRLLCRGTHADPARRFHSAEELGEQLAIDLLRQGDMALRLGNYPAARRTFSEAVQRNPRSGNAHGRLVEVAIELGDLAAAEAALEQARRAGLARLEAGLVRRAARRSRWRRPTCRTPLPGGGR